MNFVCVKCGKFYKIVRNGVVVEEGMPAPDRPTNPESATKWLPYKLYLADHYRCDTCGSEMAVTVDRPFAVQHHENYTILKEARPPLVFVEDCGHRSNLDKGPTDIVRGGNR